MTAPAHKWTAGELTVLRVQYPHHRTADIAQQLGIDLQLVYRRANMLGLRKSRAFEASDKSGRVFMGGTLGQVTQFRPGQKPWNTGLHYVAGGRSAETRFKPGQLPHTTVPVGSLRTTTEPNGRKSLQRKVGTAHGNSSKRWTPVSRLVWEATHGPVPDGHIVVFKPGKHTLVLEEITLERVECITRKEHAARNHPNRSNPDLARLIQLKGAITRQVNRIQQLSPQA